MFARIFVNAVAISIATLVLKEFGWAHWDDPLSTRGILTMLGVAVIFGVVNAVVKPLFKVLTGCIVLLTLGLFLLVINAGMLWLTSWVCSQVGLGWGISDGWLPPLVGTLIISAASFVATKFIGTK